MIDLECIWIVVAHLDYSDAWVDSVWSTEEAAQRRAAEAYEVRRSLFADEYTVERWAIDAGPVRAGLPR